MACGPPALTAKRRIPDYLTTSLRSQLGGRRQTIKDWVSFPAELADPG
jgi:hypothetical protein